MGPRKGSPPHAENDRQARPAPTDGADALFGRNGVSFILQRGPEHVYHTCVTFMSHTCNIFRFFSLLFAKKLYSR